MFGGLLLLSHTHLSAEEIAGCMKFRGWLCVSSHSCAADGHYREGVVPVTCFVTIHTGTLKSSTIAVVSTHSKALQLNFRVSSLPPLLILIKPLAAGAHVPGRRS